MRSRAAFLCLALGAARLAASGAEAPAEGAAADAEAPAGPRTRRYQYLETLEITSGSSTLRLASNALLVVTTGTNTVTVELRSATGREPLPDDPAPDKVSLLAGGASGTAWNIDPLVATFTFEPWEKGRVRIEGLNEQALREAASVLDQGPVANSLDPDRAADYKIDLASGGRPTTLNGRQENGPHGVDWRVTARGVLEVGTRGWTIPMTFALPDQEAGGDGAKLSAKATMVYSSAVPGPEDETVLVTTLTYPGRGGARVYTRTCRLREVPEGSEGARPERSRLPAGSGLGGKTSAWARVATLATLGVQRLAGVRQTGLAMWVAQLGVDSVAGAGVPRVADAAARESVSALAGLASDPGPLPVMAESAIGMRNLIRAQAGVSAVEMSSEAGAASDVGMGGVPVLSIAMRRKVGERWRVGPGLETIWIDTNTRSPSQSWFYAAGVGRAEFEAGSSTFSLVAGLAKIKYDVALLGTASGNFWASTLGVEWEWRSRGRLGLGMKAQYAGGDGLSITVLEPCVRWKLGRENVAFEIRGTILDASDSKADAAVGGQVSASGTGAGAGIQVRW